MAWVRYGMWDRWRDLPRFRLACEMALASYRTYVNGFPIASDAPLVITDPAGSNFKCDLGEFTAVINDRQQLYRVLFPSYVALVEDLGRELVETLHTGKGIPRRVRRPRCHRADRPGRGALDHRHTGRSVGCDRPEAGGRKWSNFKGGRRGVVEAVTIRNLCAHGIPVFNQRA